jgi:hypothetical protein
MEELLSALDDLNPIRIARKREEFAADWAHPMNLHAELLIGHRLGSGGVTFDFVGSKSRTIAAASAVDPRCGSR